MRQLTFKGFTRKYVSELSASNTKSIYRLTEEVLNGNHRLREALLAYAVMEEKNDTLLLASSGTPLYDEYHRIASRYGSLEFVCALREKSELLPHEYHKIWTSYLSVVGTQERNERVKSLYRQKILASCASKSVSVYRICRDLGLNNSNVNNWLKNGEHSKVSLDVARRIYGYLDEQ